MTTIQVHTSQAIDMEKYPSTPPTISITINDVSSNHLSLALGAPLEGGENKSHQFPEGGLKAYLTVLGAFMALACTFGQLSAFGTFQAWYASHLLRHLPASTISWIGSLQLWIFFFSVRFNFDPSPFINHFQKELTIQF